VDGFAGSAACAACHAGLHAAWSDSLHALAMRPARVSTVRARFDGAPQRFPSLAVRPLRREDALHVELLDGPGRTLPLAWVMGHAQVEQFLTPAPGGRLQALPVAWDPGEAVWFDLFPNAAASREPVHWMGRAMTANGECIACHVTGFVKGYDAVTDAYATRWVEPGVGCEACHGPRADHVARRERGEPDAAPPPSRAAMTTACAPCHSRRIEIASGFAPGRPIEDFFDLELLDSDAYHADGQQAAESYEWTGFQTSRMAADGVLCQDCHDPHRGRLRAAGDALCLGCHDAALAGGDHRHHAPSVACADCHMPAVVFMQRDERRDHHFSRPDPTATRMLGVPNACGGCHRDRPVSWAEAWVDRWYGVGAERVRRRAMTQALEAGRRGRSDAAPGLIALLGSDADAVRRASAARLLAPWASGVEARAALVAAARDPAALVRAAAVRALGDAAGRDPEAERTVRAAARDPVRLVRVEAGFALAGLGGDDQAVDAARAEWLASQQTNADRPETHHNRGLFLTARGDAAGAEAAYRHAVRLSPDALASRQNLAMLLAASGRDADAERELEALLERRPGWPPAAFALGLLLGRQARWAEAAHALEQCVAGDPAHPRGLYNLGLVYLKLGESERAAMALEGAAAQAESRADALRELVRLAHARRDEAALARWLPDALRADPDVGNDPRVRRALGEGATAR
jgi:predicted CXXCH cytochrome family protein